MAGQQVAGVLHMHRALEGGFEQVAQLGKGIDGDPQQGEGPPAGAAQAGAVDGAEDDAAHQAAHRAFGALVGAHAGPQLVVPEAGAHEIGGGIGDGHGRQHEDELGGGKIGGGQQQQRDVGQTGHEDAAGGKGGHAFLFHLVPAEQEAHGSQHEARAQADQGVLRAVGPGQRQHAPAQGDGADAAGDALVAPEQGEELPQTQRRHQQDEGK